MWNTPVLILLFLLPIGSNAQVVYDDFFLSQQNNVVILNWTVKSGSLCNGTTVFRKAEGGSDVQVGYIDGICGSELTDIPYSLIDANPILNAENTYYIQFGFGEFTEERSIYVRYLDTEQLYLSPNPANTSVRIEWNDEFHETYTLRIINPLGQQVVTETDLSGSEYLLSVEDFPSGFYLVQLSTSGGKQRQTRLVKF